MADAHDTVEAERAPDFVAQIGLVKDVEFDGVVAGGQGVAIGSLEQALVVDVFRNAQRVCQSGQVGGGEQQQDTQDGGVRFHKRSIRLTG